jgi:hypothetical protein
VIFSLERALSGGTRLTLELANKLGRPELRIYDTRKERGSNPDSLCLEIQAQSDFVCSNKIKILNVAGSSGIEGARRLRLDAENVSPFS